MVDRGEGAAHLREGGSDLRINREALTSFRAFLDI